MYLFRCLIQISCVKINIAIHLHDIYKCVHTFLNHNNVSFYFKNVMKELSTQNQSERNKLLTKKAPRLRKKNTFNV